MITKEIIKKMATLAKLKYTNEELEGFTQQLSNIMNMIDDLDEVNCEGIEPLTSVCDMYQRLRHDEVTTEDISNELFSNVPGQSAEFAKEIKCFIVPKVVE